MKRIDLSRKEGDPLVVVTQLEDLNKKLDLILESLNRLEKRQDTGGEAIEQIQAREASVTGSFGTSELPPPRD